MSYRKGSGLYLETSSVRPVHDKRCIGPVKFEVTGKAAAVERICDSIESRSRQVYAFCNMHTFNLAMRMPELSKALSNATVFNDGLGIDIASVILFKEKFPENLNGTDLTPAVLAALDQRTSVFLVGSPPGIAAKAASALSAQYPLINIVGTRHGFFTEVESAAIAAEIRAARTDLLLVGMGNPRQELWATEIVEKAGAVVLCVGAFIDFAAGRVSRAPLWVRHLRCEWLYRMALEPSRLWGRYVGGAAPFLYAIIRERIKQPRINR